MDETSKRLIDTLEKDFHELSSKTGWTPEDLERMKNLQKIMYYMEVRCAMKEGEEYPGSEYMDNRGRNSYDGYNSYRGGNMNRGRSYYGGNGGNGTSGHYPYGMSGRHYYDSERDKFMNDLHRMMDSEQDPATREAMENVARMLEMR